jgi:hypothetical protein
MAVAQVLSCFPLDANGNHTVIRDGDPEAGNAGLDRRRKGRDRCTCRYDGEAQGEQGISSN